jgi:hypothetical protein
MTNLTAKQIEQVKQIKAWTSTRFHGNRKKVGGLPIADFRAIVAKKKTREYAKIDTSNKSNIQVVKSCINQSLKAKGSNYFKIMIEGNTNIYYAHPVYGHSDYNKSRLFPKNTQTLKLMQLFNAIVKVAG